MTEQTPPAKRGALRSDNLHMVGKLVVVTALMFAFGYALVPIYRSICEALGINVLSLSERETTANAVKFDRNTQVDTSRKITIEFDANARGPWHFKPAMNSVEVHPGEIATVMYRFKNIQNRAMAAQAIPSYAPMQAMRYFNKLECFCFSEYTLKPGEEREWPVVFVIDPKLPKDVTTITLSYTFFEVGGKVPPAPAETAAVVSKGPAS
jgi:cytochrome c oxidase assembly protein subunit 11